MNWHVVTTSAAPAVGYYIQPFTLYRSLYEPQPTRFSHFILLSPLSSSSSLTKFISKLFHQTFSNLPQELFSFSPKRSIHQSSILFQLAVTNSLLFDTPSITTRSYPSSLSRKYEFLASDGGFSSACETVWDIFRRLSKALPPYSGTSRAHREEWTGWQASKWSLQRAPAVSKEALIQVSFALFPSSSNTSFFRTFFTFVGCSHEFWAAHAKISDLDVAPSIPICS